jgi:hypothetical protein
VVNTPEDRRADLSSGVLSCPRLGQPAARRLGRLVRLVRLVRLGGSAARLLGRLVRLGGPASRAIAVCPWQVSRTSAD